jgi:hypothetical protein
MMSDVGGKTVLTTKELAAAVLQGCDHTVLKSPMDFNDEIGLAGVEFTLGCVGCSPRSRSPLHVVSMG